MSKFKIKIAHIRNNLSIINCLWSIGKNFTHFLFGFKVKFICVKFKPGIITDGFIGSNANKHLLYFCILLFYIMNIVCSNKRYTRFP